MNTQGADLAGTMLERRYRVETVLARGGMSVVYRAHDTRLQRQVAIKVMDPRFSGDPSFLRRFELEARSAAALHHPHVVAVHDQGIEQGPSGEFPYLVMELVGGGTLRDLLDERGPLDVPLAVSVLDQVLAALAAAHRASLVHRDVKPENVLIGMDGLAKVADFGLVRAIAGAQSTVGGNTIMGTLAYLSPEQVVSGGADVRSDVYSAGIVAYEMLTGTVPFTGDNPLSVAYQHVNGNVPTVRSLRADVPAPLDELLLAATRRDPDARPPDAARFRDDLRAVREAAGIELTDIPAPDTERVERTARIAPMPVTPAPASQDPADWPTRPQQPVATAQFGQQAQPPQSPSPQSQQAGPRGTQALSRAEFEALNAQVQRPQEPSHAARPPKRSRRKPVLWIVLIAVLAGLLGTGGWWLASGRYTTVPRTTGLTEQQAQQALTDADLTVTITRRNDDAVPRGTVISSDPAEGAEPLRGEQVTLVVSAGRPIVPDVAAGASVAEARQAISSAGLRVRTQQEIYDDDVADGAVVRLDPPGGTKVAVNATVTILVSKGPAPKPVPDVTGMTSDEAFAAIQQQGMTPYAGPQEFSADVDAGKVIRTEPAAGTTLAKGERVAVIVSNAVTVPDLRGQVVADAKKILQDMGLQVQVQQFVPRDDSRVVDQMQQPGTRVAPGSTITLSAFP